MINRKDQKFKGKFSKSNDFEKIVSDINDFLRGSPNSRLATGWRSDLVGEPIKDLVEGRAALAFEKAGLVLEQRGNTTFKNKEPFNR